VSGLAGGTYGLLTTMLSIGSIAGSFGVSLIRHPRRIYLVATALATFVHTPPNPDDALTDLS
jgi:hypothetical protein